MLCVAFHRRKGSYNQVHQTHVPVMVKTSSRPMAIYGLTVLLSAFLLFQVQPIIAKMILPWFGGGSAVWNCCMMFFQITLLLGYLYAHFLNSLRNPRTQAVAHCALLAASLAVLPILPNPAWRTAAVGHPSLWILALLAATVGLPYFALSATSPLLQAWYARRGAGLPYRLFAVSNLGSLLGLLSYPFFFEPRLRSENQGILWSAAYGCFVVLCGTVAWAAARSAVSAQLVEAGDPLPEIASRPPWRDRVLWVGLAAAASMLLLSVTTHLTQNVAPVPLLWVVPLSAYLLSFILCFEAPGIYRRSIFLPLSAAATWFMAYQLTPAHAHIPTMLAIVVLTGGIFVCSMACHGELARLKPSGSHITAFYVAVSLGGAMGGLFVALVAPNLFNEYAEYPIGLGLLAIFVGLACARGWRESTGRHRLWLGLGAPLLGCLLIWLGIIVRQMPNDCRVVVRNFYGQLRVRDVAASEEDGEARRRLIHGLTIHGEQIMAGPLRRSPGTYFCPQSGIGRAMQAQAGVPRRIGILGLGCGALAAYGRKGDVIRIYEINPLVLTLAQTEFSYLHDSRARIETVTGDGRLALESEPGQGFDLLVMDAFSGDSVPVHLVTREAFRTYFHHLKPGGILAVNISNTYLDLKPVVAAAAAGLGKTALAYDFDPEDDDKVCFASSWALLMEHDAAAARPALQAAGTALAPDPGFRQWTDDYSGMLTILKRSSM